MHDGKQILDDQYIESGTPNNYEHAGFGIRVGASLIDALVMIPFIVLSMYNLISIKSIGLLIGAAMVSALYKPFMEYRWGATLGKMATSLKVMTTQYQPLTVVHTIKRSLPFLLSQVFSLLVMLQDFTTEGFDEARTFLDYSMFSASQDQTMNNASTTVSILILISCLWILANPLKQALHDLFAETYCLRKQSKHS